MSIELSVIIPTYNRVSFLEEAIRSILLHPYDSGCEIIVCDDGSTDDIGAVCNGLASTKHRILHSRTVESYGAQVARNRGVSLAKGRFVMFVDSDDVLAKDGVNPLLQILRNDSTLQYAYGKVQRTDARLKPLALSNTVGEPFCSDPKEIAGYHWHTMGAVYRRSYLAEVGPWNVTMTGSQDWEYQARAKLAGGKGVFVDSVVGLWRQHDGERVGATKFRPDYIKSVMIACDVILRTARNADRCDSELEWRLAKKLIVHALEWGANGHTEERKACFFQAGKGLSSNPALKAVLIGMAYSPALLDRCVWRRLTRRATSL